MSTSEAIGGHLRDISLEDECFDDHRCGSYLRAFLDNSLIEAVNPGPDVRGFYHNASIRQPKVGSAVYQAIEGGGSVGAFDITVTGNNLFLLREVSLNGVRIEATEVVASSFEELRIIHPLSHEESEKNKGATTLTLSVKTAFGECSSPVVEEYHQVHSEGVNYLLRKTVLNLVLLAKMDIRDVLPSKAELKCLEVILRNFGGMSSDKSLKTILTDGGLREAEYALKIADKAASNIMKPLVFEFEKGNLADDVQVIENTMDSAWGGVGRTFKAVLVGAIPVIVGAPQVGAVTATICGSVVGVYSVASTSLVCLFSIAGWVTCEAIDRLSPIVRAKVCKWYMSSYDDFLEAAVKEACRWNGKYSSGDHGQSYTERDLVEEVNGAHKSFQAMLRAASSEDRTQRLMLSTESLSTATYECTRQFLRKIYAVVETRNLYERYVSDKCFVAIVGLEDVGKTSFIQEVVPESVPQSAAGIDVHTEEVKPYKLKNGLILLDFPGSNGVTGDFDRWFAVFIAMPSIIVMLLNFEHNIKTDQIEMYESFRKRISSPILVVFNKVDKQVEKRTMKKYTEPYFSKLRKDYANDLKCDPDSVVFGLPCLPTKRRWQL